MYRKNIVPIDKKSELLAEFSAELENIIKNAYLKKNKKDRSRARLFYLAAILLVSLIILRPNVVGAVEDSITAYMQSLR